MKFELVSDNKALTEFYLNCGLEIENGWEKEMNPIKSLAVLQNGKIICAATLSNRFNRTVLDYIGVIPSMRRQGMGKSILQEITKDCGEIYLTARNADFFRALGFFEIQDNDLIGECSDCPQYNLKCFPKAMKRG